MKHSSFYVLFFLFSFFFLSGNSNAITLSNNAEISLLTCGPGEELYSIFGHSAIRVCDTFNKIDRVYNYGTFDFNTEHFYLKFAGGRLLYYLDTEEYWGFINSYTQEERSVYEQILNLDSTKKQLLFDLLEKNCLPENKEYRYEFFYDNCSTRIRDILLKTFDNKVDFSDYIPPTYVTYRKIISHYIESLKWVDLGIDLLFGLPADHKMTQKEYMFLPFELKNAFEVAHKINDNSKIVKESRTLYLAHEKKHDASKSLSPILFFWLLFAFFLLLTFFEMWRKINFWFFDFILFFVTGLLGLLILSLIIGSTYITVNYNFVMLWAIPFHFFMSFFLARKHSKFVKYYFLFTALLMILLLICWYFLPQQLNIATIPLVLTLTIRALKIFYFKTIEKTKRINSYY